MKAKDQYKSISARKYANGALEYAKTGKTNNSQVRRSVHRWRKTVARQSRPKRTRYIDEN